MRNNERDKKKVKDWRNQSGCNYLAVWTES